VLPTDKSYFTYISDICRTTSVSGVGDQTPDSYIAVHSNDTPPTQGPMAAIDKLSFPSPYTV